MSRLKSKMCALGLERALSANGRAHPNVGDRWVRHRRRGLRESRKRRRQGLHSVSLARFAVGNPMVRRARARHDRAAQKVVTAEPASTRRHVAGRNRASRTLVELTSMPSTSPARSRQSRNPSSRPSSTITFALPARCGRSDAVTDDDFAHADFCAQVVADEVARRIRLRSSVKLITITPVDSCSRSSSSLSSGVRINRRPRGPETAAWPAADRT